jgi:uncharacterized protein YecT (DUF1311 family)
LCEDGFWLLAARHKLLAHSNFSRYDGGGVRQPMRQLISTLILAAICSLPLLCLGQKDDPCPDGFNVSNAEMKECYWKAQTSMNKMADLLAARAAAKQREISPSDKALYGPVVLKLVEQAATGIADSQVSWRRYRDQYCDAVRFSYTTGSGAWTAQEECLYRIALARVRQLRIDFPDSTGQKDTPVSAP